LKNIAIIDLGTNTFNLLISNTAKQKIYNEKIAVKLGKGGISKGYITEEAMDRALSALIRYKQISEDHGADQIYAIATSAVRSAANGNELIEKTLEKTGIKIQVIDGEQEAELIYLGVRSALDLGTEKSLIVDIGGGSVEFIIADRQQIFWKKSFEIGAQRLLDRFHKTDPIPTAEINNLEMYLEGVLQPVSQAAALYKPVTLAGSSGTFDTLAEINIIRKNEKTDYGKLTEYTLEIHEFEKLFSLIISKSRPERMAIPGMIEMRVDMIVVACGLIDFVLKKYDLQRIRVSSYSLKEGVLEKAINGFT
jgi:exopolyphosphatase / guanosine-5'-triphosphate,3'-diphosphate pyrophosphatase